MEFQMYQDVCTTGFNMVRGRRWWARADASTATAYPARGDASDPSAFYLYRDAPRCTRPIPAARSPITALVSVLLSRRRRELLKVPYQWPSLFLFKTTIRPQWRRYRETVSSNCCHLRPSPLNWIRRSGRRRSIEISRKLDSAIESFVLLCNTRQCLVQFLINLTELQ